MQNCIIAILVILSATAFAHGEIQLGISGNMNWISGSDFNSAMRGMNKLYGFWFTNIQGSLGELGSGAGLQGEAVYFFSPNVGVGLGLGAFRLAIDDRVAFLESNAPAEIRYRSKLTVMPVTLNLHYRQPLASRLRLDGYAGVGLYLSRFDLFENHIFESRPQHYTSDFKGSSREVPGLQCGVGLEFEVTRHLALFLGGGLRLAVLSPVSGRASTTLTELSLTEINTDQFGDYYYFDHLYGGESFGYIIFAQSPPVADFVRNARKAEINLSGASLSCGIRIGI